jgi:hypothetical protein
MIGQTRRQKIRITVSAAVSRMPSLVIIIENSDRVNLDSDLMCLSLDISVVVVGGLLLASGLF